MFRREAKRCCFYFCFYTALITFFSLMMAIFFRTIDAKKPRWILNNSLIGSNPGLTVLPTPEWDSVIYYNSSNPASYYPWINKLDNFLSIYKLNEYNEYLFNCNYDYSPPVGKTCAIDLREYGPCSSGYQYGYNKGHPCVFVKLNKIFGWEPQYYNPTSLPNNMPEDLKQYILHLNQNDPRLKTVWVSCRGENSADQENIGAIQFLPRRGFPGYFFPYTNQHGYLSPLVAIYFENPTRHVVINVVCEAWAANLVHDYVEGRGVVRFSLLVD